MRALSLFKTRRILITFFLGFSSGLPLLTTLDMLKAWLTDSGADLAIIGFSGIIGLPYTIKFLWAPVFDYYLPPIFGRRRGWMIICQLGVIASLCLLAGCEPLHSPVLLGLSALAVTFFSASQDIVLDAHRRDTLADTELGLGGSLFVAGYRIGMLMSGAVALNLAEFYSWPVVYLIMAACMAVGLGSTILAPEPDYCAPPRRGLLGSIAEPLKDYFSKPGAWTILAFILCYKLGDMLASTMTIPFYRAIGFHWGEVGSVAKVFGLVSNIVGGILGGLLGVKLGIYRALWVFGVLQAIGILGFAGLVFTGPNVYALACVISFENLSIGLATAAFVAMMGVLCNKSFSATQYALLTSLSGVPRTVLGASTGVLAESTGWAGFFVLCFVLAFPGLWLLRRVRPYMPNV